MMERLGPARTLGLVALLLSLGACQTYRVAGKRGPIDAATGSAEATGSPADVTASEIREAPDEKTGTLGKSVVPVERPAPPPLPTPVLLTNLPQELDTRDVPDSSPGSLVAPSSAVADVLGPTLGTPPTGAADAAGALAALPPPGPLPKEPALDTELPSPHPGEDSPSADVTGPDNSSEPGSRKERTLALTLSATSPSFRVGDILTVQVIAHAAVRVVDAPFDLAYDPDKLRFLDATPGEFLRQDAGQVVFLVNGTTRPGDVAVGIGRTDRKTGVSGTGVLARVHFACVAPGTATLTLSRALAWSDNGSLVPVTTGTTKVTVW